MSPRNTSKAAAPKAAATQTAPTSPTAEATSGDRGAGSGDAASSTGAPDTIIAGQGGDTLASGDQADSVAGDQGHDTIVGGQGGDSQAGGDQDDSNGGGQGGDLNEDAYRAAHAALAVLGAATGEPIILNAQPSASSAPQVSDPVSASDVATNEPSFVQPFEMLLGSSIQPAIIDLGQGVSLQLGQVVAEAARRSDMPPAEWNAQDEGIRESLIDAMIDALRDDLACPRRPILIEVTSRDDRPYRRCGGVWTRAAQVVPVHALVAARLRADPHLVVKLAPEPAADPAQD